MEEFNIYKNSYYGDLLFVIINTSNDHIMHGLYNFMLLLQSVTVALWVYFIRQFVNSLRKMFTLLA